VTEQIQFHWVNYSKDQNYRINNYNQTAEHIKSYSKHANTLQFTEQNSRIYRMLALQSHCTCGCVQKTCLNRTRSHCKFRSVKVITSLHNRQCVWNSTPIWQTPITGRLHVRGRYNNNAMELSVR